MIWFLLVVGTLELLNLGLWLMNQRDTYQFYLGLLIISGIFVSYSVLLYNKLIKNNKQYLLTIKNN